MTDIVTTEAVAALPLVWGRSKASAAIVSVIVFAGLTAWETKSIKEQYDENADLAKQKLAVFEAFSLLPQSYLPFSAAVELCGRAKE